MDVTDLMESIETIVENWQIGDIESEEALAAIQALLSQLNE